LGTGGRLAIQPCPGGLGARSASALSPLVAAGSHDLLWDALLWDARQSLR